MSLCAVVAENNRSGRALKNSPSAELFTILKLFHLNPGFLEPLDPGSSPTDWEKNLKFYEFRITKITQERTQS